MATRSASAGARVGEAIAADYGQVARSAALAENLAEPVSLARIEPSLTDLTARAERHLSRLDYSVTNDAMLARLRSTAIDGRPLHVSEVEPAKGGDFYLATSGDFLLATCGDFLMATDSRAGVIVSASHPPPSSGGAGRAPPEHPPHPGRGRPGRQREHDSRRGGGCRYTGGMRPLPEDQVLNLPAAGRIVTGPGVPAARAAIDDARTASTGPGSRGPLGPAN